MAAESVKIVLEGVDEASPAFAAVAGKIEDTAKQSKKLSSSFSQIFVAFGMDDLAGYTHEFGSLSGQLKDLAEQGKRGGAGMLLAKAGIVAAVAAASYNVGKMIGDWINDTAKWSQALQDALAEMSKGEQRVRDQLDEQFQLRLQIAQEASGEEQQKEELKALEAKAKFDLENQRANLAIAKQLNEEANKKNLLGLNQGEIDRTKAIVEEEQKKLELFESQLKKVRELTDPSSLQQQLNARKQENEDAKKFDADRKKASEEAWSEFKKKMDDEQAAREDQKKRNADFLYDLKAERIELTEGKRAADAFRDSLKGISADTIAVGQEMQIQNELLAAQKELADEQKEAEKERRKAMNAPVPALQAVQSRLLSRASTGGGDRVAKASEKTAELTEKIEGLQRELLDYQKRRGVTELAVFEG